MTSILAAIAAIATAVGYWFQKAPTQQEKEIQQARKDEQKTNARIDAWAAKPSVLPNSSASNSSPGNGKS